MNKFQKRVRKLSPKIENSLVIGGGLSYLPQIIEIFKTVFVVGENFPEIKSRNLVYRENFDDFSYISDLSVIFFQRSEVQHLDKITHLLNKFHPLVIIEGNDPIERDFSEPLYRFNFNCSGLHGFFHVWELKK